MRDEALPYEFKASKSSTFPGLWISQKCASHDLGAIMMLANRRDIHFRSDQRFFRVHRVRLIGGDFTPNFFMKTSDEILNPVFCLFERE
jgi:hypothetical protein